MSSTASQAIENIEKNAPNSDHINRPDIQKKSGKNDSEVGTPH